jgi:hypothetical protein
MKYLRPAMGFNVTLHEASLMIAIKGYKLNKDVVPDTYGDIMKDLDGLDLDSLSFHEIFEELLTKNKFFMQDKAFAGKNIFFLRKCTIHGTYHWVYMIAWDEGTYAIAERQNANYFVEPWRSVSDRKILLEDSIFFVLHSSKKL